MVDLPALSRPISRRRADELPIILNLAIYYQKVGNFILYYKRNTTWTNYLVEDMKIKIRRSKKNSNKSARDRKVPKEIVDVRKRKKRLFRSSR